MRTIAEIRAENAKTPSWPMYEKGIAEGMLKRGYRYVIMVSSESDRCHYFKGAWEIGKYMRENYPNDTIVRSGKLPEAIFLM